MQGLAPVVSATPWVCLALALGLVGCLGPAAEPGLSGRPGTEADGADPWAPVADGLRKGPWLGGPDPVSGKLRSGVATYYRWGAVQAGKPVKAQLELRFEAVSSHDATVNLAVGDGAEWAAPIRARWRLKPGVASHITVQVWVPAGDSYLHVTTAQNQRASVKSIVLAPPAAATTAAPAL